MRFPLLAKAAAIGVVIVTLTVVLMRIDGLVSERRVYQRQAAINVAQSLAGAQTVAGPLLQRRCTEEWDRFSTEGKKTIKTTDRREVVLQASPDRLLADAQVVSEPRYRGVFKVNGYAGPLTLTAHWDRMDALQLQREHKDSRVNCDPIVATVAVSDVRGIRKAAITSGGQAVPVKPGTPLAALPRGLQAELPASSASSGALSVEVRLELVGTSTLGLVPAADDTQWTLRADWPHPSFGGRFLPQARQISAAGFSAEWSVSALASDAAARLRQGGVLCGEAAPMLDAQEASVASRAPAVATGSVCLDTMDVSFIDPINPYSLTDRAIKYSLLVIVLTFAAVALTEVLARARVHPIQYLLVGLALALFYLLLLSLSEHMAFGAAYALGSGACVLLLGYYASHMLGRWRAGSAFGAAIGLLYGLLWVLLEREQTALVIGSVVLFAALAAVMVLTRRVDWYTLLSPMTRQRTDGSVAAA
jgi:inner membrane protein